MIIETIVFLKKIVSSFEGNFLRNLSVFDEGKIGLLRPTVIFV